MRRTSYRQAARRVVSLSIAPYGYTLTIWTSGAVLTHARGVPTSVDALLFMLGAVAGFALVGAASFGGIRANTDVDPHHPALWGGLHVLPIALAIGLATLIADMVENLASWPLAGFAVTTVYLALLAGQLALAG